MSSLFLGVFVHLKKVLKDRLTLESRIQPYAIYNRDWRDNTIILLEGSSHRHRSSTPYAINVGLYTSTTFLMSSLV
jgi:hypothetical protein